MICKKKSSRLLFLGILYTCTIILNAVSDETDLYLWSIDERWKWTESCVLNRLMCRCGWGDVRCAVTQVTLPAPRGGVKSRSPWPTAQRNLHGRKSILFTRADKALHGRWHILENRQTGYFFLNAFFSNLFDFQWKRLLMWKK